MESPDGRQGWSLFADDQPVTRCGSKGERIVIAPFDPQWCGPNSFDVHLGDTLLTYAPRVVEDCAGYRTLDHVLDPENPSPTVEHKVEDDGRWLLLPGKLYLASTVEWFGGHGIVPVQHGRSSWGRYGVFTNVTAGFCDDGWEGHLTLELVVVQPIRVRPGCRIAQIAFHELSGERQPYKGRYNLQGPAPVASRFHV